MGVAFVRRRAFTLVELLVVVGIIALLIAMLMPALNRVRKHADRMKCAANLHGIGRALALYTHQHGHYPGWMFSSGGPTSRAFAWPARLRPFLGGDKRFYHCPSRDERFEWTNDAPGPAEWATAGYANFGYEVGERVINARSYFSYGYNGWGQIGAAEAIGLGDVYNSSIPLWAQQPELKASRVRRPAEMIAIADSTGDGYVDGFIGPYKLDVGALPGRVHDGGANVLFCDGHVQWYLQKDLEVPLNTFDPVYGSRARMWNFDYEPR